jgi:hypothetical protein
VTLRSLYAIATMVIGLGLLSCNDSPNDIGSELGPGIDSLYAMSSIDSVTLLSSVESIEVQRPLFNSPFFFLGKSADAEARAFIEFINYPSLGNPSDWDVLSSDLLLHPFEYRYGDTANTTFGFDVHELTRLWDPAVTWDSIWNSADGSSYYSPASEKVGTFRGQITSTDTLIPLPFNTTATKQWLIKGADSTLRDNLFGLVILPTVTSHVRLFRNSQLNRQVMRLRVITKHKDSTEPDTTLLESAVACFVRTPKAAQGTLITQGAVQHRVAVDVSVAALPKSAVILDAALTLTANPSASINGSLGIDDVLRLTHLPPGASTAVVYQARRDDASHQYVFRNLAGSLQAIMRSGDTTGRLIIQPDDFREVWRMNRTAFHSMSAAANLRPRLTVVYAIPRLHP